MFYESWFLSVPAAAANTPVLKERVGGLGKIFNAQYPPLRVGTLDALMTLCDDMYKIDIGVDQAAKKIATLLFEVRDDLRSAKNAADQSDDTQLTVNGKSVDAYMQSWVWDEARYSVKQSLQEIVDDIAAQSKKLDDEVRNKHSDWTSLKHNIAAQERKTLGNLLVRSLSDLGLPEDIFFNTEHFTTVFAVVSKHSVKEWDACYETLCSKVVPRSSKEVFHDDEYVLFRVILFRNVVDDFKNLARERRFTVREFSPEGALEAGKDDLKKLTDERNKQKGFLLRWCKTNFSTAFAGWVHLKVIRSFVESVLRYGLPAKFNLNTLQPARGKEKKLREILALQYKDLSSKAMMDGKEEETAPGQQSDQFFPYVSTTLSMHVAIA